MGNLVEIMPWEGIALGYKAPLFAIGVRRRVIEQLIAQMK